MNFLGAVKAMKEGKEAITTSLTINQKVYIDEEGSFRDGLGVLYQLTTGRILADWSIVKENKPLSDYIYAVSSNDSMGNPNPDFRVFGADQRVISSDKVAEKLKELLDWLYEEARVCKTGFSPDPATPKQKAKELFGEPLLKTGD